LGGEPTLLMANAEGMTWIGRDHMLFSEIKQGMHIAVVTSGESRSGQRDVYVPAHERAMAHFSHLSPDGRWVLVVEMDQTASWRSRRLVPFGGGSPGRPVGPEGACTSAGWSPDERWMYFAVKVNGESHLWRQRFPNGTPEQLTFGPAQEEGLAVDPDGRSLITAIGFQQNAIWIQDSEGDRPVSSEGSTSLPVHFSSDGRGIYYLVRSEPSSKTNELWRTELASGKHQALLSGFDIESFALSTDETALQLAALQFDMFSS
jgi:Tol biopolymer transport system component